MNKLLPHYGIWLAVAIAALGVTSISNAQNESRANNDAELIDVIAQRRSQLESRLQKLKRSEQALGENHPSVSAIRAQIDGIEQELQAWSSPSESLLEISDRDLRAIVLQLAIRIDRLENRANVSRTGRPTNFGLGPR